MPYTEPPLYSSLKPADYNADKALHMAVNVVKMATEIALTYAASSKEKAAIRSAQNQFNASIKKIRSTMPKGTGPVFSLAADLITDGKGITGRVGKTKEGYHVNLIGEHGLGYNRQKHLEKLMCMWYIREHLKPIQ